MYVYQSSVSCLCCTMSCPKRRRGRTLQTLTVFSFFPLSSKEPFWRIFSDWNLWPSLLLETKARHPGLFTAWFLLWNCAYLMAVRIWQMFFSLRNLFFIIVQQFARGTSAVEQREMSGDLEQFSVLFSVASSR